MDGLATCRIGQGWSLAHGWMGLQHVELAKDGLLHFGMPLSTHWGVCHSVRHSVCHSVRHVLHARRRSELAPALPRSTPARRVPAPRAGGVAQPACQLPASARAPTVSCLQAPFDTVGRLPPPAAAPTPHMLLRSPRPHPTHPRPQWLRSTPADRHLEPRWGAAHAKDDRAARRVQQCPARRASCALGQAMEGPSLSAHLAAWDREYSYIIDVHS